MSASVLDGDVMLARFVYRVPGPVRPEVAAMLDDRYGPNGWTVDFPALQRFFTNTQRLLSADPARYYFEK